MKNAIPNPAKLPKIKKIASAGGVKQMRGPGENLGLKKPRVGGSSTPAAPPLNLNAEIARQAAPTKGATGQTGSYLPAFAKGGKVTGKKK